MERSPKPTASFWRKALSSGTPSQHQSALALAKIASCTLLGLSMWFVMPLTGFRRPGPQTTALPRTRAKESGAVAPSDLQQSAHQDRSQQEFEAVVSVPESEYLPDTGRPSASKTTKQTSNPRRSFATVDDATAQSCSTSSVTGLSKQIIAQSRCIDADAFVSVPERPNLRRRANVFLYLSAPARNHLLAALDANKQHTLEVTSALRTVAQQYQLSTWGKHKRCGIQLAAQPGKSNHETGLAIDISEHWKFRSALERHGFTWLGESDPVHFNYTGKGAVGRSKVDVKAFQQLWNRNHPKDVIPANGNFSAETARRLGKSPASGFPQGARCG